MLAFVHEDKACFDELYNGYRQPISAFYSRRVTDRAQAEELMQETFLPVLHAVKRVGTVSLNFGPAFLR